MLLFNAAERLSMAELGFCEDISEILGSILFVFICLLIYGENKIHPSTHKAFDEAGTAKASENHQ